MKNFFTINPKTREHGLDDFIICRPDSEQKARYDELTDKMRGVLKKKAMPMYFALAVFFIAMIFLMIFTSTTEDAESFAQAFEQAGYALIIAAAGGGLSVLTFIIVTVRIRKYMGEVATQSAMADINTVQSKIAESLRVPADCATVDIFCNVSKKFPADGGTKENKWGAYSNLPMWVYKDSQNLYFADVSGVWAVPLYSIQTIVKSKKYARFAEWNKDVQYNSPQYRHAVKFNNGSYYVKPYYKLQLTIGGNEWEIVIPAYEIDTISLLTGITPAE